jgi:hypothetical protein
VNDTTEDYSTWRCKCGLTSSFGKRLPDRCDGCLYCGTTLALAEEACTEPMPHDFSVAQIIRTDDGQATISHCLYCGRTRQQVEERDKRDRTITKRG